MEKREFKENYKFLSDKISKGQNEGLTIKDYVEIKELQEAIDPILVAEDEEWSSFYYELEGLKIAIYSEGLFNKFSTNNIQYIQNQAMLLPLVLANSEGERVKITGDNGYLFKCQFHNEINPSMQVNDIKNRLNCYGCGIHLNNIKYLQKYENLSFRDSILLISQIYLYDMNYKKSYLEDISKKYQQSLMSDQYLELLKRGYDRLKTRYNESYKGINIDELYKNIFDIIERIKNGQYDKNFVYEKPKEKIYIK